MLTIKQKAGLSLCIRGLGWSRVEALYHVTGEETKGSSSWIKDGTTTWQADDFLWFIHRNLGNKMVEFWIINGIYSFEKCVSSYRKNGLLLHFQFTFKLLLILIRILILILIIRQVL